MIEPRRRLQQLTNGPAAPRGAPTAGPSESCRRRPDHTATSGASVIDLTCDDGQVSTDDQTIQQ